MNATVEAFGTYEAFRDEIVGYEDNPYQYAVKLAVQGNAIGDTVLFEWSGRIARELLEENHPSVQTKEPT
jgi:hypothetical protein